MKLNKLIFLSFLLFPINGLNYLNLINSYFHTNAIKSRCVFTCLAQKERLKLFRNLTQQANPVSVLHLNKQGRKKLESISTSHGHVGIVLDADCVHSQDFLKQCGDEKLFDVKHHWLITLSYGTINSKFQELLLNINADINAVFLSSTKTSLDIWDVYNPASQHGGELRVKKIGQYSEENGYKVVVQKPKYFSRRNMTGTKFKSLVVLPVPFNQSLSDYLNNDDNRDINTFNRMHNRLVQFLRDYFNFSVQIAQTPSWGYTYPNGSFDGMVGALSRQEIDFGSSPLFLRTDRAQVIDYGRNTWILRAAFLFRNPKAATSFGVFLQPLATSIWVITGVLASIAVILFKVVTNFERRQYHLNEETSWSLSALFTLGAFCQQGAPSTPRMACGRITTISIFLLSVLIYQFYSASLVSNLLTKPSTTIKNLLDLLLSPLKAGCEDILYDRDYFQHTTDQVALDILSKKILRKHNRSNFLKPDEGLVLVAKGGFAFHVETATAYPIIESTFKEKAICELREVQLFKTQPMHANYQKYSPFRDAFDSYFQHISEVGILHRERNHWHPRKPQCIASSDSVSFNVGLDEFYPALMGLLIGIVSSLTILIIEKQVKIMDENPAQPPIFVTKKSLYPYVN